MEEEKKYELVASAKFDPTIMSDKNNHKSISFVDDFNHMVAAESITSLNKYLQFFHDALIKFYECNGLAMNKGKTKILLYSPKRNEKVDISVGRDKDGNLISIKDEKQIKILGFWTNTQNNMSSHIQKVNANISNSIRILNPVFGKVNMKQRKQIITSRVTSQIDY